MLELLKVRGNSLYPEYKDGDFVLLAKSSVFFCKYSIGNVVVVHHPIYGRMIKRIDRIDEPGKRLFILGDHEDSLDSRQLGWIDFQLVKGRVIAHIRRKD